MNTGGAGISAAFVERIVLPIAMCSKNPSNSKSKYFLRSGIVLSSRIAHSLLQLHTKSPKESYEALGLSQGATQDEIKTAFYTLSKKYHPDVIRNESVATQHRFIEIKEAYDILNTQNFESECDNIMDTKRQRQTENNTSFSNTNSLHLQQVSFSSVRPASTSYNPSEAYDIQNSQRKKYAIAFCLFICLLFLQFFLTRYMISESQGRNESVENFT